MPPEPADRMSAPHFQTGSERHTPDKSTTAQYANHPAIQIHGHIWSKALIGEDCIEHWRDYIERLSAVGTPAQGSRMAAPSQARLRIHGPDARPKLEVEAPHELTATIATGLATCGRAVCRLPVGDKQTNGLRYD